MADTLALLIPIKAGQDLDKQCIGGVAYVGLPLNSASGYRQNSVKVALSRLTGRRISSKPQNIR